MAHLVWLVQQLHFLVQSHVLIGEGEIPDRKMGTWHYGCPGDVNVVQLWTLCVKALHVRQRIIWWILFSEDQWVCHQHPRFSKKTWIQLTATGYKAFYVVWASFTCQHTFIQVLYWNKPEYFYLNAHIVWCMWNNSGFSILPWVWHTGWRTRGWATHLLIGIQLTDFWDSATPNTYL